MKKITTVKEYIEGFPKETQLILNKIRTLIIKTAPKATEKISYMMPSYHQNGPLVYFGGYKNHIGLYPTSSGIKQFNKEIAKYKSSKGAVQFQLNEPIPYGLIEKIVKSRLKENSKK